jgi:hypothetical protein
VTIVSMPTGIDEVRGLSVRRLSDPDQLSDLVTEWGQLEKEVFPRTPFTSALWIQLWWRHFKRNNLLFRDEFFCHVVRDDDGLLVALAPLMRTYCLGLGPALMRIVQFFGNDPSLTEFRGVICRREDHFAVMRVLMDHFLRHCDEWDVFRWSGLQYAAPEYSVPSTGLDLIVRPGVPDYIFDVPKNWDELRARVSGNMRKNLRKAYEFFERDGFSFVLRVVERPDDVHAAIDRFLALHTARSEVADMITHPNKFVKPHARAFMVEYLRKISEIGQLKIFELEVSGKVVASRLTFMVESCLYLYFAGYDPIWKKYSIMTILMSEIIKWTIENDVSHINLSTGNDQSKLRWRPHEIVSHNALQISPTLRGSLAFRPFLAYEALSASRGP